MSWEREWPFQDFMDRYSNHQKHQSADLKEYLRVRLQEIQNRNAEETRNMQNQHGEKMYAKYMEDAIWVVLDFESKLGAFKPLNNHRITQTSLKSIKTFAIWNIEILHDSLFYALHGIIEESQQEIFMNQADTIKNEAIQYIEMKYTEKQIALKNHL